MGRSEAQALLAWYRREARALPWRTSADPWAIWVSEVMLQQTQVATVIGRYEPFMKRFPTVSALARATEDEVLAAWSGLGYYGRARRLRRGAIEVVASGGVIPTTVANLRRLPGVGEYTAAAIASIAFGRVVPVLDGNVERVLTRWLAHHGDPKGAVLRRALRTHGETLLVGESPGEGNQALMELGALVCRPREPLCRRCPLADTCRAFAAGKPTDYPTKRRRRPTVSMDLRAAVVRREDGRVLLFRRAAEAPVLAGTWELPWVEASSVEGVTERLAEHYGGSWRLWEEATRATHAVTYRRLSVTAHRAEVTVPRRWRAEGGWFDGVEMEGLATSSLVGKLLGR